MAILNCVQRIYLTVLNENIQLSSTEISSSIQRNYNLHIFEEHHSQLLLILRVQTLLPKPVENLKKKNLILLSTKNLILLSTKKSYIAEH